jgi:hypothetical protein
MSPFPNELIELNKDQGRATDREGHNPVGEPQGNGVKQKGEVGNLQNQDHEENRGNYCPYQPFV